jgi:hypothetical protein
MGNSVRMLEQHCTKLTATMPCSIRIVGKRATPSKIQPEPTPPYLHPLIWIWFHPSTFTLCFAQTVSLRKAPFIFEIP